MSRSYSINADQAIAGSTSGYQRITQSGAYVGVFTKAKYTKAGTGAEGIEFTFKADDGAEANYLTLYTHNAAGGETYGYAQLNALMACLKQRQIAPQAMQVKEYDHGTNQEVTVSIEAYPQLMNVPVGVVLQREEYQKRDGSVGESMNLQAFFDPATRQTGGEIIKQQPASAIDGAISNLRDKTLAGSKAANNASGTAPTNTAPASTQAPTSEASKDFDDSIPF